MSKRPRLKLKTEDGPFKLVNKRPKGPPPKPFCRAELDQLLTCDCGETHPYDIMPSCHPQTGTVVVSYEKETGILSFGCPECNRGVCRVQVAEVLNFELADADA